MKKNIIIILAITLLVVFVQLIISSTGLFKKLELITYDMRAKLATDSGPFNKKFKHADENIVIVSIDDFSRKEIAKHEELKLGSFPWTREVWVDVVDYIEQGEPKAILFDLIFNELNDNSWNDRRFAQELRKYDNVVLATSLNDPKYLVDGLKDKSEIVNSNYQPINRSLDVSISDKTLDDNITFYSHAPVHNLYTKNNMMGVVNKVVGSDSVIRNTQPIFKLIKDGETYYMPSLSFAGFLKYMGEGGEITVKNNSIKYKDRIIPIDKNGEAIISWHGVGRDYKYVPISKLFLSKSRHGEKTISSDFFKDKIVIIGRSEAGTDIHTSAVNPSFAGPESNAVVIDNLINDSHNVKGSRKFISKISPMTNFLLVVVCIVFIAGIGIISKNAFLCFINSSAFMILYAIIAIWLFANPQTRLWVPIALPLFYFLVTTAIVFAFKFQKELSQRATIMNAFGKFVSPKVLSTILKKQDNLTLQSTKKRITVLFCDVKNFTTLSEKSDPQMLVDNLNEMFNIIVDVIFENNGTVDKFIGDCIMAYWGDPISSDEDAYMAVKSAIEIKRKVKELAIKNAKEDKIILDVKIGINTGEALLGLSGSEKIMSYTAMGDAVNVASRLESNCSKLGKDVLISKSTYEDAKSKIVVMEAGTISVKGRNEQIEVYEPIGLKEEDA